MVASTSKTTRSPDAVVAELKRLMEDFFRCVSFEPGESPAYCDIERLFIDSGLLIKNSGAVPEISTLRQFIEPRQALVEAGKLTKFHEAEINETTQIFGNVAHRFSTYAKSGLLDGAPFEVRGMISTQFILTPAGWRMSSMAWDDERPGLALAGRYEAANGSAS